MMRTGSNLSITNLGGNTNGGMGGKYDSLRQGSGIIGSDAGDMSPDSRRKKATANPHLQPMNHKQAMVLQPAGLQGPNLAQSESHSILTGGPVVKDRVTLEKLLHNPSVKSNLMSQEGNQSQTDLNAPGTNQNSFDYQNMPIGKKTILAPLANASPMIGSGKEA